MNLSHSGLINGLTDWKSPPQLLKVFLKITRRIDFHQAGTLLAWIGKPMNDACRNIDRGAGRGFQGFTIDVNRDRSFEHIKGVGSDPVRMRWWARKASWQIMFKDTIEAIGISLANQKGGFAVTDLDASARLN